MKMQKSRRLLSLFLAALMCVTTLVGFGTTAYAAEETDEVCLVSFPRDGDANYGGEWGHSSFSFMNGWSTSNSRYTTVRAMGSYEGNICYCIEPGVPQESGDRFTKKGENFWDNYPSSYNHTISPDDIKLFIGRIFQYGYTGTISTSWRSQNEGSDKLAHAVATQLLVWETVVGERDENFNKVSTGGKDAICDQVSAGHPLYSQIMRYYNSIAASVHTHSKVPSFFSKSTGKAQNIELEWDKVHRHTHRHKQCAWGLFVHRKRFGNPFLCKRKQADDYRRQSAQRYRYHYCRKEKLPKARGYHLDGRRLRPEWKTARYCNLRAVGQ